MNKENKFNIEENLSKLEKISKQISDENVDIDASINMFEESIKISNQLKEELQKAKDKITLITNDYSAIKEEEF